MQGVRKSISPFITLIPSNLEILIPIESYNMLREIYFQGEKTERIRPHLNRDKQSI
jgi:hypothetical protein